MPKIIERWPYHSGVRRFPVPHPQEKDPEIGFYTADNLWEGTYGNLRLDLMRFLWSDRDNWLFADEVFRLSANSNSQPGPDWSLGNKAWEKDGEIILFGDRL